MKLLMAVLLWLDHLLTGASKRVTTRWRPAILAKRKIVEECAGCGFGPVEATLYERDYGPPPTRGPFWFCDFCYGSHGGSATICASNAEYREYGSVTAE